MYINDTEIEKGVSIPEGCPERPTPPWTVPKGKVGTSFISKLLVNNFIELLKTRNRYLEVGSFDGIAISMLAEQYPDKDFYAIDLLQNDGTGSAGCLPYIIQNNKHLDNVHLYTDRSQEVMSNWLGNEKFKVDTAGMFDIVFIDGNHTYEDSLVDMCLGWSLLNENGVMVVHDTNQTAIGVCYTAPLFCKLIGKEMIKFHGEGGFIFK